MSCDSRYASKDACGVQHVLLCDFAQGTPEEVVRGATQFTPSAPGYHTAVDRLSKPSRYIVWSPDMNHRILPKYVISFSVNTVSTL